MTFTALPRVRTIAFTPLSLSIAVAFTPASSVLAQTTRDTKVLDPVVVTATRAPLSAKDVLADHIVITSAEIARSGQKSLVDLLQTHRGVEIARNGGPGTSSSVFLRGAENKQNVVLVDGVRVGSSTTGGASWAAIPLSQIERIEIVHGPLSTLYGADAIGGVVQVFTKTGDGAPRMNAMAGYGTNATETLEVGVSGASKGEHRFRYAISAAHDKSDGFSSTKPGSSSFNADDDGYKKHSANGQLGWELAQGHEVGLTFVHSRLDSQFDAGPSSFDARNVSKLNTYGVYTSNQILPGWRSQVQLSRSEDKSDSITSTGVSTADTAQNAISWQNDVTVGSDLLQLLAERREEHVDTTTAGVSGKRATNSAAASYLLRRGAHLGSIGIRSDRSAQFGSHTTGNLGYGYRITSALRANASVGTSFRAPTFNELYFPRYGIASNKPEEGKNAEVGMYYEDGASQLSAVYYRNRVTNLIVNTRPCPVQPALYRSGCAYNVDEALLTGISFGASRKLGSFTLRGSLDLQDPRDETTGKSLARRAKRHGALALDYTAGAIGLGAETVFSGKRFDTAANTTVLGGYGLLHLYASYDLSAGWTLFGRWNNVLDKEYEVAGNYATEKSSVFVGLRYGFM